MKLLLSGLVILSFMGGYTVRKYTAFFTHDDYKPPKPASTRALEGCEAVLETSIRDRQDSEQELWRCERREESLQSTLDCLLRPINCRSKDPSEPNLE